MYWNFKTERFNWNYVWLSRKVLHQASKQFIYIELSEQLPAENKELYTWHAGNKKKNTDKIKK